MSVTFEDTMPAYLPYYSLQQTLALEHQGMNPDMEATLRQSLQANGINLHSDILYGPFIDAKTRLFWQAMGIDPDSKDEVLAFLNRHGIEDETTIPGVNLKKRF